MTGLDITRYICSASSGRRSARELLPSCVGIPASLLRRELEAAPGDLVARPATEIGRSRGRVEHHHVDGTLADVDGVSGLGEVFLKPGQVGLAPRFGEQVVHL